MDLKSGYPFWIVKNGLLNNFPALREDIDCDVLVIGAGITGALVGWHLQRDGHRVCVIDRREAGWGSTAASTALLQYEIDTELQELAERYGEADALLAYRACADAIPKLRRIARRFRGIDFQSMHSLYYASHWYHRSRLLAEAALRRKHGFTLRVLDANDVRAEFGFEAPAAILTPLAAETDPYQMAHRLLADIVRNGGQVFDRTAMAELKPRRRDVLVHTDSGVRIRAQHLVLAAGYESQRHLDENVASNRSSYAFVTDPVEGGLGPLQDCLVWESARPYLYVRRTGDGRLLVGGEDDKIDIPLRRDAAVMRKSAKLMKKVSALFPALPLQAAFAWAGTFAETADGLPFFGPHEQHGPRVHFAMAYGGNGITYSLIGAELLRERIAGRAHPCAELFSFARLQRM
ncbi:MAG: FAD-dependent oxidoreductase [Dokdonella sp.]